jgi:hypothetical protein
MGFVCHDINLAPAEMLRALAAVRFRGVPKPVHAPVYWQVAVFDRADFSLSIVLCQLHTLRRLRSNGPFKQDHHPPVGIRSMMEDDFNSSRCSFHSFRPACEGH